LLIVVTFFQGDLLGLKAGGHFLFVISVVQLSLLELLDKPNLLAVRGRKTIFVY
jgi:hypothetical protein